MPSEVVRAPEHSRQRSLGWLAIRWMEHFLIHGPGDIAGRPIGAQYEDAIPLTDELVGFTVDSYALDTAGRRLYESAFYSRPKGCDKSGQGSRLVCFESLGPCRFSGWAVGRQVFDWGTSKGEIFEQMDFRYEYLPGEPMGRPIVHPFIRVMATEESQTGNIYDAVYMNLHDGPLRMAFSRGDDIGLTRTYLPDGGEIRPSTASSAAKDGGIETFVSFDETHLYTTPELWRMYTTVRRNLGKRKAAQPWSFEPSTMYEPGRRSVAEATHKLAEDIRDGKSRQARLLFDHREAPADTNLDDEDSLRAGLMEAYGDAASYIDIERLISDIWDPRADRADSTRFFLNRAIAPSNRAFDITKWRAGAQPETTIAPGELITIGFDGSRSDDSTVMIGTHVETGFQWPLGIWERDEKVEGWQVPEEDVAKTASKAFETYRVCRMYCDPSKWETRVAEWEGEFGDDVVIKWPTSLQKKMATALKSYANAIVADKVTHADDPRVNAHMANAYRNPQTYVDDDGGSLWLIRKDYPMSPRKIDAAMAGCLSWQARLDALASGVLNEEEMELNFY